MEQQSFEMDWCTGGKVLNKILDPGQRDRETERQRDQLSLHTNGAKGIAQSAVASNTNVRSPGSRILFKTLPPVRKSISRDCCSTRPRSCGQDTI